MSRRNTAEFHIRRVERHRARIEAKRELETMPILEPKSILRQADHAVREALRVESLFATGRGGHRHSGSRHPLLCYPLPKGWRRTKR